jgi:hypothetical protein
LGDDPLPWALGGGIKDKVIPGKFNEYRAPDLRDPAENLRLREYFKIL